MADSNQVPVDNTAPFTQHDAEESSEIPFTSYRNYQDKDMRMKKYVDGPSTSPQRPRSEASHCIDNEIQSTASVDAGSSSSSEDEDRPKKLSVSPVVTIAYPEENIWLEHKVELFQAGDWEKHKKVPRQQFLVEVALAIKAALRPTLGECNVFYCPKTPNFTEAKENNANIHFLVKPVRMDEKEDDDVPPVHPYCLAFQYKKLDLTEPGVQWTGPSVLTYTQLAVLNSVIKGGRYLCLQAHFIDAVPNLDSVRHTLISIKLDFNCLPYIPMSLTSCHQLQELYLRDNPMKAIPAYICRLRNLRILELSFCLLQRVPPHLFLLPNLEILDLSYNFIRMLPPNIDELKKLRILNLRGNQLSALPWRILRLSQTLTKLNGAGNFFQKSLWTDYIERANTARRVHLAVHAAQEKKRTYEVRRLLLCDTCKEPISWSGLLAIKGQMFPPFSRKVSLPMLFITCSTECQKQVYKWPWSYWEL